MRRHVEFAARGGIIRPAARRSTRRCSAPSCALRACEPERMMDMLHARLGARGLNALSHDYDTPTCPPVPSVYSINYKRKK